jgi:hypothetical protein
LQKRVLAVEHQLLPAVVLNAARAGGVTRLLAKGGSFTVIDGSVSLSEKLERP